MSKSSNSQICNRLGWEWAAGGLPKPSAFFCLVQANRNSTALRFRSFFALLKIYLLLCLRSTIQLSLIWAHHVRLCCGDYTLEDRGWLPRPIICRGTATRAFSARQGFHSVEQQSVPAPVPSGAKQRRLDISRSIGSDERGKYPIKTNRAAVTIGNVLGQCVNEILTE